MTRPTTQPRARSGGSDVHRIPRGSRPGGRCATALLAPTLLLASALAGCAGLGRHGMPPPEADEAPPPTSVYALTPGSDLIGQLQVVTARGNDTFSDIARRYDLGYEELVAANPGIDPWVPGTGTRLLLPTQWVLPAAPREGIVLNVAAMRLFYYPPARPGAAPVVVTHPVGIGREDWATPLGVTRVVAKQANPVWNVPASIRAEHARDGRALPAAVPPGPDNPLGRFALRLARPGYLIHGTNKPDGIGMRVSHGCIQLYPEDISRLFKAVPVGTPVRIVNQPYLAGWLAGRLYLDAHRPLEEDKREGVRLLISSGRDTVKDPQAAVDWNKVKRVMREARGVPTPVGPGRSRDDALSAEGPAFGARPAGRASPDRTQPVLAKR